MRDSEGRNVTWRAAAAGLAVFYALVVLMNAPAMEKNAENMGYGVVRDATKALLRPVACLSARFRLDFLRREAARVREWWLPQFKGGGRPARGGGDHEEGLDHEKGYDQLNEEERKQHKEEFDRIEEMFFD